MRVLVLGGTGFIGRHVVEALLGSGHEVASLSRGRSSCDLPQQVEMLRADRDDVEAIRFALADRTWDACVDASGYTPGQVRATAAHLSATLRRYVYLSAVSVYGDPPVGPVTEDQPLLAPAADDVIWIDGSTYGPLKAACEQLVRGIYGERCTVLRPQVVVGPGDPTPRLAYWLDRASREGEMLAPGDGADHVQFIDARDVARFVKHVVENAVEGTFNLAGPRLTWREFLTLLGAANPAWVSAEILQEAKLTFVDLPLFRPRGGPRSSLMHVSYERAAAAGLSLTKPAITFRDVRESAPKADLTETLSPARAAALIDAARPR